MYRLNVREHLMIAHSFRGEVFGPAQALHGATYVVDACFEREQLDADGLVIDIGLAGEALKATLAAWNYSNLDELDEFAGKNTTTEFLARALHDRLCTRIAAGELGEGARTLDGLEITLHESHIAWAAYRGPVSGAGNA